MADYTFTTLSLDGASAAITAQNGQASADIPLAGYKPNKFIFRAYNSDANTATITLGAGGANGLLKNKGTLVATVANAETKYFGPFEASRFTDTTGDLLVAIAMAGGGNVTNVKLETLYING